MTINNATLCKEDELYYKLQSLYSAYGYRLYKMRKFEEYSLYADNKNFLMSENVITFNDLSGKLLALKPDVTLSIVKNTNATLDDNEKVFYRESVYRLDGKSKEFKEINQVGLELLGEVDNIRSIEVLTLALKSLQAVSADFMLDVSHMGIICAVCELLPVQPSVLDKIMDCIRRKSVQGIRSIIKEQGLSSKQGEGLIALASGNGSFLQTIKAIKSLGLGERAQEAIDELEFIYGYFSKTVYADKLRLDFSVINDENYYTGIIFQGFIRNVPKPVLSGGRYDKLVEKFKKGVQALGFALCLSDLNLVSGTTKKLDAIIVYGESADAERIMKTANELFEQGLSFNIQKKKEPCENKSVKIIEI